MDEEQAQILARWRCELSEAKICIRAGLTREALVYVDHVASDMMLAQIFGMPPVSHADER